MKIFEFRIHENLLTNFYIRSVMYIQMSVNVTQLSTSIGWKKVNDTCWEFLCVYIYSYILCGYIFEDIHILTFR